MPPSRPPDHRADEHATVPYRRSRNGLPDGTRLAEFELQGVIGEGGFGIVYLAWDGSLQRRVAIKEYMPASLAHRFAGTNVVPLSDRFAETFALGLRSFINEAHLLASFDHPSLLKVHRFWESNGTAYMVMPFYQGVTLKRALARLGAAPEEGWLVSQLSQLMDALEVMHKEHCFHRDIAPDNILLLDDGVPMLLDFGAARRVISDRTQELTAFLKPGYAPVEQYAEVPSMKQGAWTDLYALGAVVHYAITGHTPPESVARLVTDTMVPLATAAAGRYSERFLRAIDHALGVRPQDRPQSVAELRAEIGIHDRRHRQRKPGEIPTAPLPLDSRTDSGADSTLPPPATTPVPGSGRRVPPPTAPLQRRGLTTTWLRVSAVSLAAVAIGGLWWLLRPGATPSAPVASPAAAAAPDRVVGSDEDRHATTTATTSAIAASGPIDAAATRSDAAVPDLPKVEPRVQDVPPTSVPSAERKPTGSADGPGADGHAGRAEAAPEVTRRQPPRKSSPNPRCAEIIARVSLGEELSAEDRSVLQKECRR